jgi:hypothetical protein
MPDSLPPAELILAPFLTSLYVSSSTSYSLPALTIALFLLDSLHNATKEMLYPNNMATILLNQYCFAPKAPEMAIELQRSTQFKLAKSASTPEGDEWVSVDSNDVDDSWVDVDESVPRDIGRGASDVSSGTQDPEHTRVVLETMKDCYKKESEKVFEWRMANGEYEEDVGSGLSTAQLGSVEFLFLLDSNKNNFFPLDTNDIDS